MPTPFEELLKPSAPKCKTCSFIANLESPTREEVAAAVSKPIYSEAVLAIGMRKIEGEYNPAPSETAIRNHRNKGHAA